MSFTIQYPTTSPTNSVTFRSPKRPTSMNVDYNQIMRHNKGGEPIVIVTANQPTVLSYKFEFELVTEAKMLDFIDLLEAAIGKQVRITDEYSVVHDGYIKTPVNEIISGRTACDYTIMFEFFKVA